MMQQFDWQFPYATKRIPLFARNVVATSQPLAAQAGLQALARGGNAVDAALAAAITLTIVEPISNGLGSDAFAIIWDGNKLHGLNASGRAPALWTPERFAKLPAKPERGYDTVTVPGAVSAWVALSEKFGKLPFGDLFEAAIRYATEGYLITPIVRQKWWAQESILERQPGFAEHFLPKRRSPHVGERFVLPGAAASLKAIRDSKGEAFYRGALAARIAAHSQENGGAHTEADFAAHACEWVEPISMDYRGHTLHELPPNGQGIAALMALGMLKEFDLSALDPDSPESLHLQIEAMKLAFADINAYVADPAAMTRVSAAHLLEPSYLKARARLIDPAKALDHKAGVPDAGGTIYLSAADSDGMMVSFIQSNYMGFGSGCVVDGISLQNRGAGFVLTPGHPNQVGPDKRPFHTIIPAFLTKDGKPQMSFGVMGGNMQPQGHIQTLIRMLDYGQNPQAACDAPRWRVAGPLSVNSEVTMAESTVAALKARGHDIAPLIDPYMDFGSGQFIWRLEEDGEFTGYIAASDSRKDGQAVGF